MREAFKARWREVGRAGMLAAGGIAGLVLTAFCVASFASTLAAGLGLLLIPLVLAAFFYPVPALIVGGALLLVSVVGYEGYVIWRRRHAGA